MPRAPRAVLLSRGLSLLEVVIAMALTSVALAALSPVLVQCTRMVVEARDETRALELAAARLEELLALPFEQDAASLAQVTDTQANLSRDPPGTNGSGLTPGAPSAAWVNTGSRFDYSTSTGRLADTAGEAAYVRRWAVVDISDGSAERLLLHVCARDATGEAREPARTSAVHRPGDAWLFAIRARTLR